MHSSVCLVPAVLFLAHIASGALQENQTNQIRSYFQECFAAKLKLSCLTDRISTAIENSMDVDLQLAPGLLFARNELSLEGTAREYKYGIDRLTSAVSKFLDTHSLSLDDDYSDSGNNGEARRRRRRRYGYLLPALLGAIGVTKAIMLKGLALVAGKALMVSKMALMLISIIGLKKLFSKDEHHEPSVVQVHALHDEHDRNLNAALYNIRHI